MSPCPRRLRRLLVLTCALATLGSGTAVHAQPPGPTRETEPGLYLVTLTGRPTASHPATRPGAGRRFDRGRPAVAALADRLRDRQDQVLASVGGPEPVYRYTTALNGVAVRLDEAQVKALRSHPDVALVERSTVQRPAGVATVPARRARDAGARDAGAREVEAREVEAREARGRVSPVRAVAPRSGRGLVVGVVDTGIWPESPSFAGLPQQAPGRSAALPGFGGACAAAEQWEPEDCNDKVVSARWFVAGFGPERLSSTEVLSARDTTGHGTHTASTVAGERADDVRIGGQSFGTAVGAAPAARLAVYKACWTAPDPADDGCATADTVAAVDRAVADGVDVISYAVAGSADPTDTLSRAFLGAVSAGVFVAAAAGNDGPGGGRVGHVAPWVATVAATTREDYRGTVTWRGGPRLTGAMVADRAVSRARLVHGRDAASADADARAAAWCAPGSLDAAVVQDAVVVCERGVVPRVDKSETVAAAGGAGMVLLNRPGTVPDAVEADLHAVPTVHLDAAAAARLRAHLRRAGPAARASLLPTRETARPRPRLVPSSSRGPAPGVDLVKPDLAAPGAAVLGAVAPPSDRGRLWGLRSGTSVSAAHVAGLAATLRAQHPRWSPAALRSALVTSAGGLRDSPGPLAAGAGQVDPAAARAPGLVLDAGPASYHRFLAGELPVEDLNLPSLALVDLVGRDRLTRRLTNVSGRRATWTATVSGLSGFEVSVRPRTVTLRPGASRTVRIAVAATERTRPGRLVAGRLTWSDGRRRVQLPAVVRADRLQAPALVTAPADRERVVVTGRSGSGAPPRATGTGLLAADPVGLSLRPAPLGTTRPPSAQGQARGQSQDTLTTRLEVPRGARALRVEVRSHNSADDLDLRIFRGERVLGAATGPGASAAVSLVEPPAGRYRVEVHAVRAGNGAAVTGELTSWVVPRRTPATGDVVGLDVAGPRAGGPAGAGVHYRLAWPELDPTRRWLGVVRYRGSDEVTLVRVG